MTGSLDGRCCVVTGATSGIGHALALAFGRAGARVYAIGRNRDRLDSLAVETGSLAPVFCDLEQDADLNRAVELILAECDQVDILVHSAGAIELGPADSAPISSLDLQYRVNVRAPIVLTQGLLQAVRRARGQVVFVNSSAALRASEANVLYAVTKAGLKAFADGLRERVNADGVRVLTMYVGRTATPMQESVHSYEGRTYHPEELLQPGDVVQVVLDALAVPRTAEVTDVSVRPMRKPSSR